MTALLVVSSTSEIGLVMRDFFGYVFSKVATLYGCSCWLIDIWPGGDEKYFSFGTHLLLTLRWSHFVTCEIAPCRHARHWICRGELRLLSARSTFQSELEF